MKNLNLDTTFRTEKCAVEVKQKLYRYRIYPIVSRRFIMNYTKEQRLEIGKRIYDSEMSILKATELYNICEPTARNHMRMYRGANSLPPKQQTRRGLAAPSFDKPSADMEELKTMMKEELTQEILKDRITLEGDGTVILYGRKNIK